MKTRFIILVLLLFFILSEGFAQKSRTQYPKVLSNSFFEVNLGYIHYPFSASHMVDGYQVEAINIPHLAPRIIPFGHNFNKYLSAQIVYLRPVLWVRYKNVSNPTIGYADRHNHPVFMNVGGLTMRGKLPLFSKFTLFGEFGLSVVTRSGFYESWNPDTYIVPHASYSTIMLAAGMKYNINDKWDLQFTASYTPGSESENQPYTSFVGFGFSYTMAPLPKEVVEENAKSEYFFPHNSLHIGFTTNAFGYGVNEFVSEKSIPIFWGGKAQVRRGVSISYQRNIFHGKKVFSLDWGANVGFWESEIDRQQFVTLSLYPLLRFNLLRTKPFDLYLLYSLAGPTFISGRDIDGMETGPAFTFYDYMGFGAYIGKNRRLNPEIRIGHYSNGNLYAENEGVMIPLTFNLGYTF